MAREILEDVGIVFRRAVITVPEKLAYAAAFGAVVAVGAGLGIRLGNALSPAPTQPAQPSNNG